MFMVDRFPTRPAIPIPATPALRAQPLTTPRIPRRRFCSRFLEGDYAFFLSYVPDGSAALASSRGHDGTAARAQALGQAKLVISRRAGPRPQTARWPPSPVPQGASRPPMAVTIIAEVSTGGRIKAAVTLGTGRAARAAADGRKGVAIAEPDRGHGVCGRSRGRPAAVRDIGAGWWKANAPGSWIAACANTGATVIADSFRSRLSRP
jgi:hypothetical protein